MTDSALTADEIERVKEFPSLKDAVYLDHAGTTCVSRSQLEAHHRDLLTHLYGNPHSGSPSSQLTTDTIDQIRYRILKFFNTSPEEYAVVFTSGCTAALKIVGESFDFHGEGYHGNCSRGAPETNLSMTDDLESPKHDETTNCEEWKEAGCDKSEINLSPEKQSSLTGCKDGAGPWQKRGSFTYLLDSHTSVQGIRELTASRTGIIRTIDCDSDWNLDPSSVHVLGSQERFCCCGNHLFAFPGQSNFSGRKYPLEWVSVVKKGQEQWQRSVEGQESDRCQGHWYILLDAASLVSTSPLDLTLVQPDFVTLSFYKMFGFPTGLGALLIRRPEGGQVLKKTYFGGGTVAVNIPSTRFHVDRSNLSHRFEDGTVSFLDIIALQHGFDALQNLAGGIHSISRKTFHLAKYFHDGLCSCYHGNGVKLAEIYCIGGFTDETKQGAIVTFNLRRSCGDYIGFAEVDTLAQLYNIHVRTGCFCNTGACQKFLHLSDEDLRKNFDAGHVCGDNMDLIEGRPTGAVRVSFGYMSLMEDAQRCLQFIVDCFLDHSSKPRFFDRENMIKSRNNGPTSIVVNQSDYELKEICEPGKVNVLETEFGSKTSDRTLVHFLKREEAETASTSVKMSHSVNRGMNDGKCISLADEKSEEDVVFSACQERHLEAINIYPIKSCAAFKVKEWPVSGRGLLYDREWMIVTGSGVALSQKRECGLCLLQSHIDLDTQQLRLEYPGMEPAFVSLHEEEVKKRETSLCSSKVCGDRVESTECGTDVSDWLSEALGRPGCRLIRQTADDKRTSKLKSSNTQEDETRAASHLSLANESQFLLINSGSVAKLQEQITLQAEQGETNETFDLDDLTNRFRANLLVSGCDAFEEDDWTSLQIGSIRFTSQGPCTRCHMVCLDQATGEKSKEPLRTLAVSRGAKATFGIHLCIQIEGSRYGSSSLRVGDPVFAESD